MRPGWTVALVGPSGAGKSTALSLIPRLHDVSGGAIMLDGVDLRDLRLADLRDAIAYVSQDTTLFDMSVLENIRIGRPNASRAEVEAAALAAAVDFADTLPQGLDTRVGPGGQRLSGGQRQRVALARACCAIRACCCSMKRRARSIQKAKPRFRRRFPISDAIVPPLSWRTVSRPSKAPISSSS